MVDRLIEKLMADGLPTESEFADLKELLRCAGRPDMESRSRFVFLGDFVDRGYKSLETFLLLLCFKVGFKDRVFLLRGNHESRQITQVYGFYEECVAKYGGVEVWQQVTETFDYLPLSAVADGSVFCVHGGISPSAPTMDHIRALDRRQEVPHDGVMCDLLWGDPEEGVQGWAENQRGAGWLFGEDAVRRWHHVNRTELICRSHQLVHEGYRWMFGETLVTVWSAPNYSYRCGNSAAILEIDEFMQKKFKVFQAAPNPAADRCCPSGPLPELAAPPAKSFRRRIPADWLARKALAIETTGGTIRRSLLERCLFDRSSLTPENAQLLGQYERSGRLEPSSQRVVALSAIRAFKHTSAATERCSRAADEVRTSAATHHAAFPLVAIVASWPSSSSSPPPPLELVGLEGGGRAASVRVAGTGAVRSVPVRVVLCCQCAAEAHGAFEAPWAHFDGRASQAPSAVPTLSRQLAAALEQVEKFAASAQCGVDPAELAPLRERLAAGIAYLGAAQRSKRSHKAQAASPQSSCSSVAPTPVAQWPP
eukprot:m51a1_g2342 putative serine threonine-protein phosphatase 4 catalytic subunit (538) ;mRNA; r:554253-557021